MTDVPVVVPDDKTPIDLTLAELDTASRDLGYDVAEAFIGEGKGAHRRWAAAARLAWLWARRTDPKALLKTYLDYDIDQISHALAMGRPDSKPLDPTAGSDETSPSAEPDSPTPGDDSPTS